MLIAPKNDEAAVVRRVDAWSRVAVWTANHVNSPMISKLGLTHVLDGAADASGKKILHASGPGLTLERRDAVMPQYPYQNGMLLTTALVPQGQLPYQGGMLPTMVQAPQHMGYAVPFEIPQLSPVPPHGIPQIIGEMTGGYDPVYVAEELGLFQRDMDKVSGPKLCRAFCDPLVPVAGLFNMECCDADGNFAGRYVLFNGSVFEAKLYKYTDWPDGAYFFFAPSKSAIFAPQGCDGTFTTNANLIPLNRNMGWLCTAGSKENMNWEIIRPYGKNARLVWPAFPDDPLLTRNQFAEAFAIVTEARRKGIDMKVLRAEATVQFGNMWEAKESLLDDREIKKLACKYGLEIDPIWNDLPGEIDFDDGLPMRKVPPFWTHNRIAVFFGMRTDEFLVEIIRRRPRSAMFRHPLVVVDKKDWNLANQVHAAGGNKISVVTFDVFQNKDAFLATVPSKAKMIFIVPPSDDIEMKVITPKILNVCAKAKLPVGIFSRSADASQKKIASDTVLYNVAKSKSAEDVFFVRNININSDFITRYKFSPAGVEEALVTKDDIKKELM